MDAGKHDQPEDEPQGRSLAEGVREALGARLRGRTAADSAAAPAGWPVAGAVALLIVGGPLVTLAGAEMLAAQARSQATRLSTQLAPRTVAERAAEQARALLGATIAHPPLGVTLDAVARALPAGATVLRAERTPDGALELEISAADPDQIRPALRSLPGIGTFRNTGQRQSDAGMIVSFRAEPQ